MRRPAGVSLRHRANPLEEAFLNRASWLRLALGVLVAVLVLSGVAGWLAWRQYGEGRQRAESEAHARVVLAAAILNAYFGGEISTLESIADAPPVIAGNRAAMRAYFERVQPPGGALFNGGLGWIDRAGISQVSSNPKSLPGLNVSDRSYFTHVVSTDEPYVSQSLVLRRSASERVVVIAVPTRDARGRLTGVLAGALRASTSTLENQAVLDLGFAGLSIIDRSGDRIIAGGRPSNGSLLSLLRRGGTGTLARTRGLDGAGDHMVAYATAAIPGWTIVIDRPRSAVFAAAWRSLVLELVSIGAAALIALGLIGVILVHTRRRAEEGRERARRWSELRRTLDRASAVGEISDALIGALASAFENAFAVVALKADDGLRVAAVSGGDRRPPRALDRRVFARAAALAFHGQAPVALATEALVRKSLPRSGRTVAGRVRSLYSAPLVARGGNVLGAVVLLFGEERVLDKDERTLIAVNAGQAAQSLARALRFERDHEVALTLQRSLLSESLPGAEGVDLAGRYRAGADGLEVGGDWYDGVRRRDGLLHLTVGDVAGRGIRAAALMGELRHAFRAYAQDHVSPAEVVRRLLRHLPEDEMATAVCFTVDPYTGELAYASAGHPPLLLVDDSSGEVRRLDGAGAPPLGFTDPASIFEERLALPARSTVVAYTDGLVERRGRDIDDGIELVESAARSGRGLPAAELAESVLDELLSRLGVQDDIALLVVRAGEVPARMEVEIPAEPSELARLRARLRAWLTLRGVGEDERADVVVAVSEACNNAIEHGYAGREGSIRLLLEHAGGLLRVVVEDDGGWEQPNGADPERHRGIPIIRGVMDEAEIDHDGAGTRVTLARRVG
jgi:serine phosphatase RsbU (regulator of sigma subunit)/anti-sigma regulatory factor (Ser/Thr protein kinase)